MSLTDWQARAACGLGIFGLNEVHRYFFSGPENTPLGIFVYLGTSALSNFGAIVVSAHALRGMLSLDLQRLAFCAIVVNFLCFLAYLAKISPVVFNTTITVISYAQLARLLWRSNGDGLDTNRRNYLFRWLNLRRSRLHYKEAQR